MQRLAGTVRHYAWGSPTAIPALLGCAATGEPVAEYWLGAHREAPSAVGDTTLDVFLRDHPDYVGDRCLKAFGDQFPVLMKLLAAQHPLSLQAHPDREQAEEGYALENDAGTALDAPERTYRDTWPKPELIVALTPFEALCGFRDPAVSTTLFEQIGVGEEVKSVIGPLTQRRGPAAFAEVFLDVLSLDDSRLIDQVLTAARGYLQDHSETSETGRFAQTAVYLDTYFPADPGIFAALLLNRVTLAPGQGLYLPPHTLHSYLHGVGVEVMASSDNVVRGALTKKHVDIDEVIHVVDFTPRTPAPVETEQEGVFTRYLTPTPEFAAWRGELGRDDAVLPRTDACRIVIALDGTAVLHRGDVDVTLAPGEAAVLGYGEEVTAHGDATLFVTSPGV